MTGLQINSFSWNRKWPAPAKLNLMLRITGQRDDGYHLLQTVFQLIDLCDWLTFHPVEDDVVYLKKPIPGVPQDQDLTVRAACLLKEKTGYKSGVCIEIEKKLPMGGGLGGGSSDAATTLVVLNELWKLGLSIQQLMQMGLSLGADVPVFVFGYSAWAEGVGEFLERIDLPESWFVVMKPDCHVVTREVFCAEDLTRDSKSIKIDSFMSGQYQNDCLEVVRKLYSPVKEALIELSKFGEARLTGTGACVFVQFDNKSSAKEVFDQLKAEREVYLVKGLNVSPLRGELNTLMKS